MEGEPELCFMHKATIYVPILDQKSYFSHYSATLKRIIILGGKSYTKESETSILLTFVLLGFFF